MMFQPWQLFGQCIDPTLLHNLAASLAIGTAIACRMSLFVISATFRRASISSVISGSLRMTWFRRQLSKSTRSTTSAPPASPSSTHSWRSTTTSRNADILRDCHVEQFYEYTSGRWLWDEKYQLARRHVEFNLPGLLEVSAQAIGARSCVKIEKLPEGNFNKVFLISMDDGRELIAKLPNPNAGPTHFTTASEAATMDYVRTPLPVTSDDC